ncbi:hypothetical protein [Adhaeribacter pallidiroseus]|uniref:Nucleolar protein n=1 Tax=Adhaeribacter pallidiroseus TaxID=2072847 RepID=A0A369QFQ9_9BACT|nr:hypothetical protein [Adhaeribacter pallidiroseus]RDC63753.1 Nucleolar protein [Adhaeribacter pallidiroseus]
MKFKIIIAVFCATFLGLNLPTVAQTVSREDSLRRVLGTQDSLRAVQQLNSDRLRDSRDYSTATKGQAKEADRYSDDASAVSKQAKKDAKAAKKREKAARKEEKLAKQREKAIKKEARAAKKSERAAKKAERAQRKADKQSRRTQRKLD